MRELRSIEVTQLRSIVQDLFRPKPWIYWSDLLVSLMFGYGCAAAYVTMTGFSLARLGCFIVAGLALYRASLFMHEVVHFRKSDLPGFHTAWNLLAGVPMLTPSFFYESHLAHHNTNDYGTTSDGEYLPLARGPLRNIAFFMAQAFVQPIFVVTRFTLLTPISFLHPRLRQWTLEHASSFVMNWRHHRRIPANAPRLQWAVIDVLCSLRAMGIGVGIGIGATHWTRILTLYSLAVFILTLNYLRTLAAHRYRSDGHKRSHVGQLLDSVDIIGSPLLTELWGPVGLRYHALHHLFPSIPYHNLGIAHRRLMKELPADAPYRQVVEPSYFSALLRLLSDARKFPRERQSEGKHAA